MAQLIASFRLYAWAFVALTLVDCTLQREDVQKLGSLTSTLSASPAEVVADGVSAAIITATLHTADGNPLVHSTMRLRTTCVDAELTQPPATDDAGSTQAKVSSRTPGRCFVSGEAHIGVTPLPLGQLAAINFVPASSMSPPSAARIQLTVSPNEAAADGQAVVLLHLSAADAQGTAILNRDVALTVSGTHNALSSQSAHLGPDGMASVQLTSTTAETKLIEAQLDGAIAQAQATFVPGTADSSASGLTVSPAFCVANGACPFTARVMVRDLYGNSVAQVPVTLSSSDANDTIAQATSTTDASGQITATFTTQVVGDKVLFAQVDNFMLQMPYAGVAASPNVLYSALSVGSGTVVADGTSIAAITVRVADDTGRAMSHVPISLQSLGLPGSLQPDTGITDDNGEFIATYKSASAGNHIIIATLQNKVSLTHDIAFVSGAPSFSTSQIFVSPSKIAADDTQTADITVLLKDSAGNPASGATVTFSASNAGVHFNSNQAISDSQGRISGLVRAAAAGNFIISAAASSTMLTAPISCTVGPPNPGVSGLRIMPDAVLADGVSLAQLELNVFDLLNNPVPDVAVHVLPAGPNLLFSQTNGLTDAQGRFRATVSASQAQNTVISMDVAGTTVSSRMRFLPGLPSPTYSALSAQPNTIIAGGGPSVLVVAVKDATGNPVPGAAINLQSRDGGVALAVANGTTDDAGTFYTQVRATQGGIKTIEARVGSMLLTQKLTATAGVPSAMTSALLLDGNKVVADGSAALTLTFTVRDILGNPVVGAQVTFAGAQLADTVSPAFGTTDAAGTATARFSTTRAGATTVRAQAQDVALQATVQGVAGPVSAARSSCTTEPNAVRADGSAQATATLVVLDSHGNFVTDAPVALAYQGTSIALVPTAARTSSMGTLAVQAASTVAQQGLLVATVGGTELTCSLNFVPGPASAAQSSASVVPSPISADGSSLTTFRAQFRDAQRNFIAGREATLTASGTSNTLSANRATTDAQGRIAATLQSTVPEVKTISAQLDGVTVSAPATFVAGPPGALSAVTVSPSAITADGTAQGAITVTLRDNEGNLVAGQAVSLQLSDGPGSLAPLSGTTDASGQMTAVVTSTTAGTRLLTATAGTQDITAAVTFVPGPLSTTASVLTISPNQLTADGNAQAHLQFVAADAFGNLIDMLPAAITSDAATLVSGPQNGNTDATGQFTSSLSNTVAQAALVTLTADGQTLSAPTTWLAGPVAQATSALVASPNNAVADGADAITATLTLRDAFNNPAPNRAVTFACSGASLSPIASTTDGSGSITVTVKSFVAESKTLTATVEDKTLSLPVVFRPGPADQASSSLALQPNVLTADGISSSGMTFTLKDAFGNAIAGQALDGNATGTTAPFSGMTDAAGLYTASLVSTVAQSENITVRVGALSWSAAVQFLPGPPAAANSNMTVLPATLTANAIDSATIRLTVRDAFNNVVPSAAIVLDNTTALGDSYGALSGSTDSAGMFSTTISSTLARSTIIRAALGTAPTPPAITAPVTFLPGPANANASAMVLSPNFTVADGNASAQVQVAVKDAYGNAVGGAAVRLSAVPGSCTFTPSSGTADGSGAFTASMASTVAQAQQVTASLGSVATGQNITQPFVFVAGPPTAEASSLVISPNAVVADGAAAATTTITLRDAQGNVVANQNVTLSSTGGNNTIVQPSASGQPAGVYVASLASTRAQSKTLTAYFNGRSVQAVANFVAGPAVTAKSTVTASPNAAIWANGVQPSHVAAAFFDAYGNAAGGQPVTFSSDQPDTFSAPSGTTQADGSYVTQVRGRTAGTHTVKATCGSAQPTVQLSFVPAAYPANSTLTASPNALVADSNTQVTLTLTARDGNNQPLSGAAVRWGGNIPGFSYTPSKITTDASGVATTAMRGNVATQQTAYASLTGVHVTAPVTLSTKAPTCSQTMSYNGLPWPEVNIGEQTDAAVADINGDGIPDLAVLNVNASVGVLLGKGGRAWQPPVSYPTSRAPVAMFMRDITGDTYPDLVVLSRDEFAVSVHSNRGNGSFNAPVKYSTDPFPDDLILMDVNNDGIADAVVMNSSRQTISVLMGVSDGTFQARTEYPLNGTPAAFSVRSVISSSNDIVFTQAANNSVSILPNLGSGTFGTATSVGVGTSPGPVAVGDLTGDGHSDIIVGHSGEKTLGVLRNLGGGSFAALQKYPTGDNITGLALAQMGGSAALDLIAYSKWVSSSFVYENAGDGNFTLKTTLPAGGNARQVRVVDADNDGYPDILLPMQSPRTQLQIQYTDGAFGIFSGHAYTAYGAVHVAAADFNADSYQDLFVSGYGGPHRLYLGSASGQMGSPTSIPSDSGIFIGGQPVVRDFDGDSFADVAIINTGNRTVSIYLHGSPGPFKASVQYAVGANPFAITTGDINDDGFWDLVVVNRDDANLSVLMGRGDGTFAAATNVAVGTNPVDAVLADVDNDGTLDLVVANSQAGTVGILLNNGQGGFGAMTTYAMPYGVKQLASADFNADGKVDLAVLGTGADPITVLLNTGGTFATGPMTNKIYYGQQLMVADFNGDGRPDIAGLAGSDPTVNLYLNINGTSFDIGRPYATGARLPTAFSAADLNGNGALDFIVVHNVAATVTTLMQDGCF